MAAGGHVMEHQAAVAVHGVDHFLHRAQAGDDDRHAMLDAQGQVGLQARVARVDDQVDGIGCWRLQLRQARLDLLQPGLEAALSRWLSAGKLPTTPLRSRPAPVAGWKSGTSARPPPAGAALFEQAGSDMETPGVIVRTV
jgi:hypothetical protein